MRILMVSSFLPFPLFSGGHVRLYNIIKELSKKHAITLVCETRDYQTDRDVQEVKKYCSQVVTVARKKQWSISNMLKTGFSPFPFLVVGHVNKQMKEELDKLLRDDSFDLIHVETFYVMQNLPETAVPVVLIEHNIEYLVYKRFTDTLPLLLRVPFLMDIQKIKYWEELFWQKADKLVAVSDADKKVMKRGNVEVVPNGVDVDKFKVQSSKFKVEQRILFIGDFKWVQNRDSVEWILKEIWPRYQKSNIKNQKPVKLWIVGRKIPESIKQLGIEGVMFDENAGDTVEIFKNATVLLAPIRVGGGTSFKILEAMASGVPVITTSLGVSGIGAKDGQEVLIADNTADMVEKLTKALTDDQEYLKIEKNARKLIEKKYDWRIIVEKLEGVYQSAIT